MKKNNVEYYRIANGKYNEDGKLVILNGLSGYNVERETTKRGFGEARSVEKLIQALEKAVSTPDKIKIAKMNNKNDNGINTYKVTYKGKEENDIVIIKIDKDVSEKNPELITRFNNINAANVTYRNTNNAKKIAKKAKGFSINAAKVAGCAFLGTAMAWAFMTGLEKEANYQEQKHQEYVEEYNARKQKEIDKKCSVDENYLNDPDCLARQEGYASYEDKIKAEYGISYEDENENTRSRSR